MTHCVRCTHYKERNNERYKSHYCNLKKSILPKDGIEYYGCVNGSPKDYLDPAKRIVNMRINNCKFFKIPCEDAHRIREILEKQKVECSYEIRDIK